MRLRRAHAAVVVTTILAALLHPGVIHTGSAAAGNGSASLSLPFASGQTWTLLGGPHDWNGSVDDSPSTEWNSLDLTCGTISSSCDGVVRAARGGVIHFDSCGSSGNYVRIDHLDGWHTTYYHLLNIQVAEGQPVVRGQPLGVIGEGVGCGGFADVNHVHFSLWWQPGPFTLTGDAGEDAEQYGMDGVDIGGWTVHAGTSQYDGCMVRDFNGNTQCASTGQVYNRGDVGSAGLPVNLAGVVGSDAELFAKPDGQPYQALSGVLAAAPAVVAVPSASGAPAPLFIAVGTDHNLFVRSLGGFWQRLSPAAFACYDSPAATVTPATAGGYTLTVACEGPNGALYYAQTPVTSTALPAVTTGFTNLGGVLSAGPAVAAVNGVITFFADGSTRQLFTRTISTDYVAQAAACVGHPAAASMGALAYVACQGTNSQLYYSWNAGQGWNAFLSAGGGIIDGPGLALTPAGAAIFVEGLDKGMYHNVIDLASHVPSGYVGDGGVLQHGAAAVGWAQ